MCAESLSVRSWVSYFLGEGAILILEWVHLQAIYSSEDTIALEMLWWVLFDDSFKTVIIIGLESSPLLGAFCPNMFVSNGTYFSPNNPEVRVHWNLPLGIAIFIVSSHISDFEMSAVNVFSQKKYRVAPASPLQELWRWNGFIHCWQYNAMHPLPRPSNVCK